MSKLEQSKVSLKKALERLEAVMSNKMASLEAENSNLRAEIIRLKQKSQPVKKEPDLLDEINEMNSKAQPSNDVEVTLSELKKLVRQD